jgi:uncharacterized protein (TIGR01777 family)
MKRKVVLAGGTGFIGQYLSQRFEEEGYDVVLISRQKEHLHWDNQAAIINALEGAYMLINLAGKPIKTKFTPQNKQELILSRTSTTTQLGNAVAACQQGPELWFNASGAHIYGTSQTQLHTELDPIDSTFFPAVMAAAWEDAFFAFDVPTTRQIALRISIVLGENGGVLAPYVQLSKWGLGGTQGDGKQAFSWIHLEDFYQSLLFMAAHPTIKGAVNLASPNSIPNKILMKSIRKALGMPIGLPAPSLGIKLGAALMGIESDLILKGLYVYPKVLIDAGFQFKYAQIDEALAAILKP